MPPPYILITRPHNDAVKLAQKLQNLELSSLIDPLITIEQLALSPAPLNPQACIVTSRNAVFALAAYHIPFTTPIYVVGHATADAVKELGYSQIIVGEGNAASLLPLLQRDLKTSQGHLVHFCGADIRFDFTPTLIAAGFQCHKEIVYKSVAVEHLQPETIRAIQHQQVLAVLFYSPKTARCFSELALELKNHLMGVKAICLSQEVAAALQLPFRNIAVAKHPTESALLDTLRYEVDDGR